MKYRMGLHSFNILHTPFEVGVFCKILTIFWTQKNWVVRFWGSSPSWLFEVKDSCLVLHFLPELLRVKGIFWKLSVNFEADDWKLVERKWLFTTNTTVCEMMFRPTGLCVMYTWRCTPRFDNEIHSRQTLLTQRIGKPLKRHKAFHNQRSPTQKITLSADDDKIIIQPDKIQTFAHGYRTGWQCNRGSGKGSRPGHEGKWLARTRGELTWGKWDRLRHERQMEQAGTWGEVTWGKWNRLRHEGNWLGSKKNGAQCPKPLYCASICC